MWQQVFDPLAAARPDLVSTQIHVQLDHRLPADPAAAYTEVTAAAHNFEAATTGGAIVGNNLGAALDAARADAAYAQVLFLFLGLPGAVLAALLTATIASSGAGRRRSEQALLRARGASAAQLTRLAGAEAAVTGLAGAILGLAGAALVGQIAFGTASFGTTPAAAVGWAAASAAVGLAIAAATILLPARRDLRRATVSSGRATVAVLRYPAWARYGLDAVLLIIAGLVFTATSSNNYQLVLAPEGVPTIAVSYWALAGPALLWIGAGLLTWRVADLLLGRGRPVLRRALHPLTGGLAGPVAAGMSRQRRPLTRAIVLLALAIAFAASTATFNATYAQQAEADAQLTNGADVTVTQAPGSPVPAGQLAAIGAVPGVRAVEPVQHRFAYIGTDLQDLYGVRPATITTATALQDTYFSGGTATGLMNTLAAQPDSILVSAETVKDYQLQVGDPINLRLVDGRTNQLDHRAVPLRRGGQRIPHRTQGQLLRRQRRLHHRADRQRRRRGVPGRHRRAEHHRRRPATADPARPDRHRHRHHHHPANHRIQPHRRRPHRPHPGRTRLRAPAGRRRRRARPRPRAWPNGDARSRSPPRSAPPAGTCAA